MTNIFCFVGPIEAGQLKYINALFEDKKFVKSNKLDRLIYGTTKPNILEPDKYYNITKEEFEKISTSDLIEFRSYYMLNYKDDIYYFTRRSDIDDKKNKNLICVASPYQYEYYKAWISTENIKNPNQYSLNCILMNRSMKTRVIDIINRSDSEDEIQEICRRTIQEKVEFDEIKKKVPEFFSPLICENTCIVDNDNEDDYESNLTKIKEFISFRIETNS